MKKFFLSFFIILFIIGSWRYTFDISCYSLFFAFIIIIVIASSYIEKVMVERVCFSNCYFQKNTFFAKILKSKIFIMIFFLIYSTIISFTLLYQIIDINKKFMPYLLTYTLFSISIFFFIKWILKNSIKKDKLNILSREITIVVSNIILLAIYIYFLYNSYEPSYLQNSLSKTIFYATNSIGSSCNYIDIPLRLHREIDSAFWFLINQLSEAINQKIINGFIWIIFIFINSLAIIGLNRFLLQIINLVDRFFSE